MKLFPDHAEKYYIFFGTLDLEKAVRRGGEKVYALCSEEEEQTQYLILF